MTVYETNRDKFCQYGVIYTWGCFSSTYCAMHQTKALSK